MITMNRVRSLRRWAFLLPVSIPLLMAADNSSLHANDLEAGFSNPPHAALPQTWWHWMNGNITKEGITADLEAMKQIGLGGAQIFNVAGVPAGPVNFMSPEWRALVKHAAREADRLGLELAIHNCPGWSSSGGPWNTPEHSMKEIVTSEVRVKGDTMFDGVIPQPPSKLDFYRDIAVLAFPTPKGGAVKMADFQPKVTTNQGKPDASAVADGSKATVMKLPLAKGASAPFLMFEFAEPFEARRLTVVPGPKMQVCKVILEASEDGTTFRPAGSFMLLKDEVEQGYSFRPVSARFYRLSFSEVNPELKQLAIAEVELSPRLSINNFLGKAFYRRGGDYGIDRNLAETPEEIVKSDTIIDLTGQLSAEGRLKWNAPKGDWTIVRVGYTPNGETNHPTPAGGEGLECDKMSKEAVDAHWAGMMAKVIDDLGPLAGKTLTTVVVDSYEVGTQSWTPNFREEFQKRRGYDLLRFLPVFNGGVVDSLEVTERFLWDFRRTIADLFAENYAGHLTELAHRNGLEISIEPYGDSPSDDLQYAASADVPMGEFWVDKGVDGCMKLASSVGHINGRKFIGAESFTAGEKGGNKWECDPYALKALGDAIYCTGINRFIFHTYTHQPWLNRAPGMTMGACGTHFERTTTWWKQAAPWMQYLARCQSLLQEGTFTADVCYFTGESVPASMYGETLLKGVPHLPRGYDFDGIDAETLLTRATAKNGRLVLPGGMSYRVLVLSTGTTTITPVLLQKIKDLADAGVPVVGPKPIQSPSLVDFPRCDEDVKRVADALWNTGKASLPESLPDVLKTAGLKPDFEPASPGAKVTFIHRQVADAEVYFVSNQKQEAEEVPGLFRISGKVPELWHPDTGEIEWAPVYSEEDGRTQVPLQLDPSGSVFVVFRTAGSTSGHMASARRSEVKNVAESLEISGPWEVRFPPNLGAPPTVTLEKLISWTDHPAEGVKYFSGSGTYVKTIQIPAGMLGTGKALYLDLGEVKNIAELKLNGKNLGVLWKPPFRGEITRDARPGENELAITITNLWPNRLIGDEQLPPDCEWAGTGLKKWPQWLLDGKPSPTGRIAFTTRRLWTKDDQPLESGLIGPVQLRSVEKKVLVDVR